MRKTILTAALSTLMLSGAFAQITDTSKQGIQAVLIEPKMIVIGKPNAMSVGLRVVSDNLTDAAGLYYVFYDSDGGEYAVVYEGNVDIKGADYANWKTSGGNDYLFTWFADKFGVTLRED